MRPFCSAPFRVTALATQPDGGLLVAGGEPARSGEIARYDRSGALGTRLKIAEDLVYALDCDGTSVVVACADGRVLSLAAVSLESSRVLHAHAGPARAVRIARFGDGSRVAVSGGRDARILVTPLEDGPTLAIVDHTGGVECLDVTTAADKTLLYSGSRDGKVRLHELHSGKARLVTTWQRLGAPVLALCAQGGVTVGLANGELRALDSNGELAEFARMPAAVGALCGNGRLLVGLDGEVRLVR